MCAFVLCFSLWQQCQYAGQHEPCIGACYYQKLLDLEYKMDQDKSANEVLQVCQYFVSVLFYTVKMYLFHSNNISNILFNTGSIASAQQTGRALHWSLSILQKLGEFKSVGRKLIFIQYVYNNYNSLLIQDNQSLL